jgi:hypothetical protein
MDRDTIHQAIISNAAERDALRPVIMAGILNHHETPTETNRMRQLLLSDETLRLEHLRWCRDIRECHVG